MDGLSYILCHFGGTIVIDLGGAVVLFIVIILRIWA